MADYLYEWYTLLIEKIITLKLRGHGSQWIPNKINIRHPWQLKKWKPWEPFWSYQLNSTANPAHLPQKLGQMGPQDFDFFNCYRCRLFILCEVHCYFWPHIFWVYYFSLSQCVFQWFILHSFVLIIVQKYFAKTVADSCK